MSRYSDPRLAFVVPTYNASGTVSSALSSAVAQDLPFPFEIIVHDDASSDDTRAVIDQFARQFPDIVRVSGNECNRGPAATRNAAIRRSRGELNYMLDADNVLPEGCVRKQMDVMESLAVEAVSVEHIRFFTEPGVETHRWAMAHSGGLSTLDDALTTPRVPASHGNYLFTRRLFDAVGGYDEERGAPDTWIFGIRHLVRDMPVAIAPGAYYWHRVGHDSYWVREERAGVVDRNALQALRSLRGSPGLPAWLDEKVTRLSDDEPFFQYLERGRLAPEVRLPPRAVRRIWRLAAAITERRAARGAPS